MDLLPKVRFHPRPHDDRLLSKLASILPPSLLVRVLSYSLPRISLTTH